MKKSKRSLNLKQNESDKTIKEDRTVVNKKFELIKKDFSISISNDLLSMFILSNLSKSKVEKIDKLRQYLLSNLEASLFYYMYSIINDYHRFSDCNLLFDSIIPNNYVHLLPLIIYLVSMENECKLESFSNEKKTFTFSTLLDHDYL